MFPKDTNRERLHQIANGDEKAFRQVFDEYWDPVYGVALALTKSTVLAEELVQEIFLGIWIKRNRLLTVEKFDDYLFIVSRNHIFNALRKKIREQAFTEHLMAHFSGTSDSPEDLLMLRETEELVDHAIEKLPPQQKLVFSLCRKQGLTQEEVARRLQISRHTVKSHMHHALRFIQTYLLRHAET